MENLREIYQNLPFLDHFFVESFGLLEGRPGRPPVDFQVFFKSQNCVAKWGPFCVAKFRDLPRWGSWFCTWHIHQVFMTSFHLVKYFGGQFWRLNSVTQISQKTLFGKSHPFLKLAWNLVSIGLVPTFEYQGVKISTSHSCGFNRLATPRSR